MAKQILGKMILYIDSSTAFAQHHRWAECLEEVQYRLGALPMFNSPCYHTGGLAHILFFSQFSIKSQTVQQLKPIFLNFCEFRKSISTKKIFHYLANMISFDLI